jgi:hypothetical protein
VTAIIVPASASAASAAKTPAATLSRPVCLGLRFINGQCAAAEFGAIQRSDSFIGFTGIGHFDERETARPAGIPIRHKANLVDRTMWLENIA